MTQQFLGRRFGFEASSMRRRFNTACSISLTVGLYGLSFCAGRASGADVSQESSISSPKYDARETVIDKVWAGHSVNFDILTSGGYQFVAYYNADRQLIVARRKLDAEEWEHKELPTTTGWDGHNYVTMTLDRDNILHVSGNMHVEPLLYFRGQKPFDIESLEQMPMLGDRENRVTYPRFIKLTDGSTVFRYRDGGSGNGADLYNIYDEKTHSWSRLIDTPLVDGQGQCNAYMQLPVLGNDGYYHCVWVWRDPGGAEKNHDLSYIRTKDFKTWEDASGNKLQLPITPDNARVIVDPIPVQGGILNGSPKVGFDAKGNVVIAYYKFDDSGNTQIFAARFEEGQWKLRQVTNWNHRFEFGGGGSLPPSDVKNDRVSVDKDGRLRLPVYHVKYGGDKVLVLSQDNLSIVGEESAAKSWGPLVGPLRKVRSKFEGMQSRMLTDETSFADGTPKYLLLWETLDTKRDRARPEPWPKPTELRLIELSEVN